MRTIDTLADRSLALATRTRDLVAPSATGVRDWVASGAALAAARGGAKTAVRLARRNPALAIATVVLGAGVLAYGAYRRRKAAEAPIDGTIDADTDDAAETTDTGKKRKPRQVAVRSVRHRDAHDDHARA
ncbi:MAG: hypothetical protein ACTHOH_03380 [Lysobacteraceae bacterium]